MSKYVAWSCDYKKNSGEGQLARKFIETLFDKNNVKIQHPKLKFYLSDYIYQIYGIIVLWYYFFKGSKIIFINYLPLWNFLIFLLSPPRTIFGPITGSKQINKIINFKSLVRYFLIPFLYKISLIILNKRQKKIIFATNILKKKLDKNIKKKSELNFVLKNLKFSKNLNKEKKYDFIIYYRKHENKFFEHHLEFIKNQIKLGKKILIIGNKMNIVGVINMGKVKKNKLMKLIRSSKSSISGDDNLYSFFNLECIQNGVRVIYNHKLNFQSEKKIKKYFTPYNYELKKFTKN